MISITPGARGGEREFGRCGSGNEERFGTNPKRFAQRAENVLTPSRRVFVTGLIYRLQKENATA